MAKKLSLAVLATILGSELVADKNGSVTLTAEQAQQLNDHVEGLNISVAELNSANNALSENASKMEQAAKKAGVLPTAKHEKKVYQFTAGKFIYKAADGTHKQTTAEEASKDEEIVAQLIKINSGVLVEIK